jgi:hypothetical protein
MRSRKNIHDATIRLSSVATGSPQVARNEAVFRDGLAVRVSDEFR